MALADLKNQPHAVESLQHSLERRRVGHAYLLAGDRIEALETLGRTLAKILNCAAPVRKNKAPVDCCDRCSPCLRIEHGQHPDVHYVRPESKSRVITGDQMKELIAEINLKPAEAEYKFGIIAGADRLNATSGNAFLKTLEEPPPRSIFILLSTEPQRILDTLRSRCLRINCAAEAGPGIDPAEAEWLARFSEKASVPHKSLLGRYGLMDELVRKLAELRATVEEHVTAKSPLAVHDELEPAMKERWEAELKAAIEAEYRRRRTGLLRGIQWWLRDVWLHKLAVSPAPGEGEAGLLSFPQWPGPKRVAERISAAQAMENMRVIEELQRGLHTNVQEALLIEVGLLKLQL
jgi:hypothetical protein